MNNIRSKRGGMIVATMVTTMPGVLQARDRGSTNPTWRASAHLEPARWIPASINRALWEMLAWLDARCAGINQVFINSRDNRAGFYTEPLPT